MKAVAVILVNYRDYARRYLPDCLASLRAQTGTPPVRLYIVDNATTAESETYLRATAPEAVILPNVANDGFAKGNNDGMRRALADGADYCILFNMDTVIAPDAVAQLVRKAESDPAIGAVQARLMLWEEKDRINSLGNCTHFLGFGYCSGYRRPYDPDIPSAEAIGYPSGAAVLLTRDLLQTIGLFDETYWMYNEDQDLGWRAQLAGYRVVLANDAVVWHKYAFQRLASKYYWMDRNRILSILKNYRWGTLFLIAPAFWVMELGVLYFAIRQGWVREKFKVWGYFLTPANWVALVRERRRVQHLRKRTDRDITRDFSGAIWYAEIDSPVLRWVNPIFAGYWRCIRAMIWW
jgi:GT2 family glycosyltransferase